MNVYPIEKYKFYFTNNKVIAISTYEGRRVRGIAKCDPRDGFDKEKGMKLAAARCNLKVAQKRERRARQEEKKAKEFFSAAENRYNKMIDYHYDSVIALRRATEDIEQLLKDM